MEKLMDKRAIKNFAINARNLLILRVSNKLSKLGITETGIEEVIRIDSDLIEIKSSGERFSGKDVINRGKLVDELNDRAKNIDFKLAFQTLVEEVSYTWFNRVIAIRFMEVNGYLPGRLRVLSSETKGKTEPDIITSLQDTDIYQELDHSTKTQVTELLMDGSASAVDELYQLVFIKVCNSLNKQLPDLFEKIDDYTEMLFTISYIDDNGIIASLLSIPEEDFDVEKGGQIEIIGWMYQYYNTEPKDKVFKRGNRKIRADEIPAATQLFTPDWIVRYMVENSLGRYYIDQKLANPSETRTEKEIAESFGWNYYLPAAEQPEDVQLQILEERKEKSVFALQELKLIDPSMGSGHILVYAFDVFMQLYEAEGELPRTAAEYILQNNLYGLDIDKRAFQLTYFALMMKARQHNRRILSKNIVPHVYAVPDNFGITEAELQLVNLTFTENEKGQEDLLTVVEGFKDGKDLGSLISFHDIDFDNLRVGLDKQEISFLDHAIGEMIDVGELLQQKYDVGITNPPYMGSSGMNKVLSTFVKKKYPNSKSDLFGVFIERLNEMIKSSGYSSLITQHSWMFLSSFEKLRVEINSQTIVNMLHLGTRAFEEIGGEVVQTAAFVISPRKHKNFAGNYFRLVDYANHELKRTKTLEAISNSQVDYVYHTIQDNFNKIPGSPISYWVSENLIHDFVVGKRMDEIVNPKQGLATADNNRFLRQWYEVDFYRIKFDAKSISDAVKSNKKWFPYNKGGAFRRWYGNYDYVVNWENNGHEIRNFVDDKGKQRSRPQNTDYYFKEAITWGKVSSSTCSFRWKEHGNIFADAGMSIFYQNEIRNLIIGLLNSKVANEILKILSPTMNYEVGHISSIPVLSPSNQKLEQVNVCIELTKNEWNSNELSWNFKKNPLI